MTGDLFEGQNLQSWRLELRYTAEGRLVITPEVALETLKALKPVVAQLKEAAGIGQQQPAGPAPSTAAPGTEPHYTFTGDGTCRSCGRAILWFKTGSGKAMPVDDCAAARNPERDTGLFHRGDRIPLGAVQHLKDNCHFGTCPNADEHRGGGA